MTTRCLLPVAVLLLFAVPLSGDTFFLGGPHTTNNDDSCDIAALPAATLLLPYFEVDLDDFEGETTLFTVTNVADRAQVVRVTLWTDYGFPVVAFNVYLTGYDVQSINLRDVIGAGRVGGEDGTGTSVSPVGELSRTAGAGRNLVNCTRIAHLTPPIVAMIRDAFTLGRIPLDDGQCRVGGTHTNAVGYATMDVVAECTDSVPTDARYFTDEIRYDNVLMGEYQQLDPASAYAQGGTMVHIRAIPEGGTASRLLKADNFPNSFYARIVAGDSRGQTNAGSRQPLPSTFVARWINGGPSSFQTSFKVWRELPGTLAADCIVNDTYTTVAEIVVFDEAENAFSQATSSRGGHQPAQPEEIPAAALVGIDDHDVFPIPPNGALAGWVYFNLDRFAASGTKAEQAWVISSMRAESRYSGDFDATALGNGCSPRNGISEISEDGTATIGPSPNTTP